MGSLNKIQIIGALGKDPELKFLQDGTPVANLSVAAGESWKDKSTGEKKETTTWFRVSFFGPVAEVASQYLKKGSQCYIEGSIRTRKYVDKNGVERDTWEVRGDKLVLLGRREDGGAPAQSYAPKPAAPPAQAPLPMSKTTGVDTAAGTVNGEEVPDDLDAPF